MKEVFNLDNGQYNKMRPVFWTSGTAFMIRKADFESAGRFDESFFAHQEEIDLCWKLHLMDKETWAIPSSVVYHKNAATLPMFSRKKQYLNHRNSMQMILSNYSLPLTLYIFPLINSDVAFINLIYPEDKISHNAVGERLRVHKFFNYYDLLIKELIWL